MTERTTITMSPHTLKRVKTYVKAMKPKYGSLISLSRTIEEALSLALPILQARIPKKGESEDDLLLRRIKEYKQLLSYMQGIYATPILKELSNLQIEAYSRGLTDKIEPLPEIKEPTLEEVRDMP